MSANRRQRRAEREARQARQPVIVVGDNMVAGTLPGHTYVAKPHAELPAKVPGRHRWIVTAAWVAPAALIDDAYDADVLKLLDHENLMELGIGCWDCEAPLGQGQPGTIAAGSKCPAPAAP